MRVSARAMAKNATADAHAGVATKSSAPNPVATPRPPRTRPTPRHAEAPTQAPASAAPAQRHGREVAHDDEHGGHRFGQRPAGTPLGEDELREHDGERSFDDVE